MTKKIAILLIAAVTITLSACNSKVQERTVVKEGDKTITVLETESKAKNEEIKIEKVKEYKNINALEWQNEDQLLITKVNKNLNEFQYEGTKYHAMNAFIFDTNSGAAKVLREESSLQRWAEFSHDKKHILFKKEYVKNAGSYIMDSQGKNEVSITGSKKMQDAVVRWIDDKNVIFADYNTGIVYEADISGKIVKIADLKVSSIGDIWKTKDQIYYVSINDGKLLKYSLTSKEKSPVEENVAEIFPATDEDRIAYTKKTTDTFRSQLIVCDKNFSNKKVIAEDEMIYGVKWSPDNTKLLYITSQAADTAGINVADLITGKATRIALNTGVSHLSWSPSGKKIAVSQFNEDGTVVKTTVYTLGN